MTRSGTIDKGDWICSYSITDDDKDLIIDRLLKFYTEHNESGEGIQQDDGSIMEASIVLSDIADDIIKFEITYKDEL